MKSLVEHINDQLSESYITDNYPKVDTSNFKKFGELEAGDEIYFCSDRDGHVTTYTVKSIVLKKNKNVIEYVSKNSSKVNDMTLWDNELEDCEVVADNGIYVTALDYFGNDYKGGKVNL